MALILSVAVPLADGTPPTQTTLLPASSSSCWAASKAVWFAASKAA